VNKEAPIPDIVTISGLEVHTIIGVYEHERQVRQTVTLDLRLATNADHAAHTDCIDDALDYHAIAERVSCFIADSRFQLIETLAVHIANLLEAEFDVNGLWLRLGKPGALRGSALVSIEIERGDSTRR